MIAYQPSAADIVGNTRSTTGTLVTVPAGRWFTGNIVLSASVAVAGNSQPKVTINGTDAAPAAGSVIAQINLVGLALTTVADSVEAEVLVYASGSNDITLDFTAGANGTSTASVNGFFI